MKTFVSEDLPRALDHVRQTGETVIVFAGTIPRGSYDLSETKWTPLSDVSSAGGWSGTPYRADAQVFLDSGVAQPSSDAGRLTVAIRIEHWPPSPRVPVDFELRRFTMWDVLTRPVSDLVGPVPPRKDTDIWDELSDTIEQYPPHGPRR